MSDKYSLIIMRDSSQKVRRLRISSQVIKFGLIFGLLLTLLIVGGAIFSFHSIDKFISLNNENSELRTSLDEAQMQLERLQNVETFLKDSEQAALYQTPMDTGSPDNKVSSNQTAEINTQEVVATVFPNAVNATAVNATAVNATAVNATAVNATAVNATAGNSTETPEAVEKTEAAAQSAPPAPPAPSAPPPSENTPAKASPAKVSNVEIKARSPKSVRLTFDLNNENSSITLAGNVQLSLMTKDNEIHDIAVPRHDMLFQIKFYKRMNTAFPLPEGVSLKDIKSLLLKISANGKDLQTETIPFPERN